MAELAEGFYKESKRASEAADAKASTLKNALDYQESALAGLDESDEKYQRKKQTAEAQVAKLGADFREAEGLRDTRARIYRQATTAREQAAAALAIAVEKGKQTSI